MSKAWKRTISVIVGVVLVGGLLTWAVGMRPSPQARSLAEKPTSTPGGTPTGVPTVTPTATPVPRVMGWYDVARYLEAIMSVDVLAMGEQNGKAFAALCVGEDTTEDEFLFAGQTTIQTLVVFGSEDNEELALSFFFEPDGDDPRYRLRFAILCDVVPGNVENCTGGPLDGGYLTPDAVLWPGK